VKRTKKAPSSINAIAQMHCPKEPTAEELALVQDGFVSVAGSAKFLNLANSTVYKLMEDGSLVFCKFGRARRIPRAALLKFAASRLLG